MSLPVQRQQLEGGEEGAAEGVAEAEAVVRIQWSSLILDLHTAACHSSQVAVVLSGSCNIMVAVVVHFDVSSALIMRLVRFVALN